MILPNICWIRPCARINCLAAKAPRALISVGMIALAWTAVFVLETNTQPGMTPLSLVPEQARHVGISYEQLVDIIVKEALA